MKKITCFCEECGELAEFFCAEHPHAKLMRAEIVEQESSLDDQDACDKPKPN